MGWCRPGSATDRATTLRFGPAGYTLPWECPNSAVAEERVLGGHRNCGCSTFDRARGHATTSAAPSGLSQKRNAVGSGLRRHWLSPSIDLRVSAQSHILPREMSRLFISGLDPNAPIRRVEKLGKPVSAELHPCRRRSEGAVRPRRRPPGLPLRRWMVLRMHLVVGRRSL
jgi:hypothetical protein